MYKGCYLCTSYIYIYIYIWIGKYYLPPYKGKYYLRKGYFPSYKGQRYYLSNFQQAGQGNHLEERFYYVHLSLRNVIERTFGVWKNRWSFFEENAILRH